MVSGIWTIIQPENPNEFCDRLNLILQEKQARFISKIIDEKVVAIAYKLLGNNCMSMKQYKFLLFKCLN